MDKKIKIDEKNSRIIILAGYCIPYMFLCLYGDAVWKTGWLYGISAVAIGLLCYFGCRTENIKYIVIGNLLSFAVSELFVMLFGLERMSQYFEPLNVHMLVGLSSVIAAMIQAYMISRLTDDRKKDNVLKNDRTEKRGGFWERPKKR